MTPEERAYKVIHVARLADFSRKQFIDAIAAEIRAAVEEAKRDCFGMKTVGDGVEYLSPFIKQFVLEGKLQAYDDCLAIAKDFTGQGVEIYELIKEHKARLTNARD